jgi:hypothetical protein
VADGVLKDGGTVPRIHIKTTTKSGAGSSFEARIIEMSKKIENGDYTRSQILDDF